MLDDFEANAPARERLSALLDGELDANAVTQACAQWRESAESRVTWHAYGLIGDALRSDDLAGHAARDAGFLAALRARMASEPVVLAPQPREVLAEASLPAAPRAAVGGGTRRWSWMAPTAVAAGFVVVASVLSLTRPGVSLERADATSVAQAPAPLPSTATLVGTSAPPAEPQTFIASGQLIRDARLDRYLAAHKQFAGSSALGVPSAYLRNATAEVPGR